MKKLFLSLAVLTLAIFLVSCKNEPEVPLTYTVTFDTDGGSSIDPQDILNGGKVTKPADPEKEGYLFTGVWLNGDFEWNFDIDIVTEDITLVAEWIEISTTPTNIKMTDELFSSSVTWVQQDADLQTFEVSIKALDSQTFVGIDGEITIEDTDVLDTVTFTPNVLPQGGTYVVKVVSSLEEATSEPLLFGGAGSEDNPYLVGQISDIIAILDDEALQSMHFKQMADILMTLTNPIEINNDRKVVFNGSYDGDGYKLSYTGNGGLFHEITESGVVKNLIIDETTVLSAAEENLYSIGAVADVNHGLIENIDSRASLTNARLQGELPVYDGTIDTTDLTTGAGGIVGLNASTGIVRLVSVGGAGAVKAGRGVGGVAAYNFGLIEDANVTATLPAGNQANSGKSSNTYSFGGGIAGFNFGTITTSNVSGRVFAQSAYSTSGDGNEGKNIGFGGIAGYNEGTISESSFARSMGMKEFIDKSRAIELEDSANNLGVASIHGDLYVGGIAGINAGDITDTYVGGAIVGGRDFVGGVVGLTLGSGMVTNTYVFAEVAIKDDGGLKITEANAKTTATTYEIAPSGFDQNSTFFRRLNNSETGLTWVPGDLAMPELPEFTSADLAVVGSKFAASGVLLWQSGAVTGVNITLDTIVLPHGAIETLEYQVSPSSAPDLFVTWTSSDETVVEVIGDGEIKGVGAGEATITVTTRDGGFTDTILVTVEDYNKVTDVTVTADVITLPEANNIDVRDNIDIGTVVTFTVDLLPTDADYQGYTITTSNSRAEANGNVVTFVYGNTGPGKVSVIITFEDSSVPSLEYRFTTVEAATETPIESVNVTADVITLPEANNSEDRDSIFIGTVVTFTVDILPLNATNQNYTITTSNSRAEANGNVVTFVYGNTGPGNVSVVITFADSSFAPLEYRFLTEEVVATTSVTVTADVITLPEANNVDVRDNINIGTVVVITVTFDPANASYQGYTVTTSNSRAQADGNTITFVYGNTGPGKVSIVITFDDPALGSLEYRFTTIDPTA